MEQIHVFIRSADKVEELSSRPAKGYPCPWPSAPQKHIPLITQLGSSTSAEISASARESEGNKFQERHMALHRAEGSSLSSKRALACLLSQLLEPDSCQEGIAVGKSQQKKCCAAFKQVHYAHSREKDTWEAAFAPGGIRIKKGLSCRDRNIFGEWQAASERGRGGGERPLSPIFHIFDWRRLIPISAMWLHIDA